MRSNMHDFICQIYTGGKLSNLAFHIASCQLIPLKIYKNKHNWLSKYIKINLRHKRRSEVEECYY